MAKQPEKVTVGMRFGTLTVTGRTRHANGRLIWAVRCDCGSTKSLHQAAVLRAKSCGCIRLELLSKAATRHGKHGSGAYNSWQAMLSRCSSPSSRNWENWGGRGITVCDRWRKFENFLEDMGERPSGMSLDRYPNNDGNYEPGNCRWATPRQQQRNTRNSNIEFQGERLCITEIAERLGLSRSTVRGMIGRGELCARA